MRGWQAGLATFITKLTNDLLNRCAMSKLFSIVTPKDSSINFKIDTRMQDDGRFRAFIKETAADGTALPTRIASLEKIDAPNGSFMVIRAPLREQNEDGSFQTRPRQRDGKFLNDEGKEVATADLAAREYVLKTYRGEPNKLVYGQIATVNVKNKKNDGTPTAMTLMSVKLYSDAEALAAERKHHQLKTIGTDHADYAQGYEDLKEMRRKAGTWADFFIDKGHDVLRDLGFEIRERAGKAKPAEQAPTP